MLNKYFAHTDDTWQKKIKDVQDHLQKADIVPLDLRYLNTENRVKIISHILSLSQKQQKKLFL